MLGAVTFARHNARDLESAQTAIVKVTTERGAELVVLGVRGPATLSDRVGWSTAYGVRAKRAARY
jgi:hypothetical protein